jgi:hypothetical protein
MQNTSSEPPQASAVTPSNKKKDQNLLRTIDEENDDIIEDKD